ncbi:MAG: metallophosphoesterase [Deltaproteobacteria bacterium]
MICSVSCGSPRPDLDASQVDVATPPSDGGADLDARSDVVRLDAPRPADVPAVDAPAADVPWVRDWHAFPAIVQIARPDTVYAVSDVHGGYARLTVLLAIHGLIASVPASPALARWSAGAAVLTVVGDLVDKGPQGLEVVDLLRALQPGAIAAGGAVVVTLGNHEAEFLADPLNSKATAANGVDTELTAMGLDPATVASATDARGQWLRSLPFAVRVGGWFFAHAGDTQGRDLAALESALHDAVALQDYGAAEVIGTGSILESRDWYLSDPTRPMRYALAVGASHLVMGHDPHALGPDGVISRTADAALFRIDCGMSPDVDYSAGVLLRVRRVGANDVAESLEADGTVAPVWTGPAAR